MRTYLQSWNIGGSNDEDRFYESQKGGMMKRDINKKIKQTLSKQHVCYVLITCDKPSDSGEMQVEMTYNGDAAVAAYLLDGAQSYMNEQELTCSVNQDKKVLSIASIDSCQ